MNARNGMPGGGADRDPSRARDRVMLDAHQMAGVHESFLPWLLACTMVAACGGAQSEPATPSGAEATPAAEPGPGTSGARPSMTAQDCEAAGGTVVGDIGDGAINRPGYLCESGVAPTGSIRGPEGAPMAVEGSVCCPK
jgi:hypothetical protein